MIFVCLSVFPILFFESKQYQTLLPVSRRRLRRVPEAGIVSRRQKGAEKLAAESFKLPGDLGLIHLAVFLQKETFL